MTREELLDLPKGSKIVTDRRELDDGSVIVTDRYVLLPDGSQRSLMPPAQQADA